MPLNFNMTIKKANAGISGQPFWLKHGAKYTFDKGMNL